MPARAAPGGAPPSSAASGGAAGDKPLSLVEAVERLRQQDPGAASGGATPGAAPGGAAAAGRPAEFPEPPSRGEPPSTAASETVTYLGAPAPAAPAEPIPAGPPNRAPPVPWGGVIIEDKWHPSDSSIHNLADYESVFLASTAETMHRHGATDKAIADSYWEVNVFNLVEGQKQEGDDEDEWGDWGARQEYHEWKGLPQEYFLQQYEIVHGAPSEVEACCRRCCRRRAGSDAPSSGRAKPRSSGRQSLECCCRRRDHSECCFRRRVPEEPFPNSRAHEDRVWASS